MKALVSSLSKQNPLLLAGGAALLLYVVYGLLRKTVTDTAKAAGGIITGNNAATAGTDYQDKGVAGTLGAVANRATGGALASAGSWIAGLFASDSAGEDVYYIVQFPDGAKHAIPSHSVAANGIFTYQGVRYQLGHTGTQRVARRA
jgi:hypothetical protein